MLIDISINNNEKYIVNEDIPLSVKGELVGFGIVKKFVRDSHITVEFDEKIERYFKELKENKDIVYSIEILQ